MKLSSTLICLTVFRIQMAWAQPADAVDQLSAGHVATVEATFATLQSNFEKGLATEYLVLDSYKVFYRREDSLDSLFDSWIKAYPMSAPAYMARGTYYRKQGEFRRGTKYISDTPPADVDYMAQMFKMAKGDLRNALRLNPKSYLAVLGLLDIAQYEGDSTASLKYLELGNTVLPSNLLVRARYLIGLRPRWGGSHDKMKAFIERCRTEGFPKESIDLLKAIKYNDEGMVAEEHSDMALALSKYREAMVLSESGSSRFRSDYLGWSGRRICVDPEERRKTYCQ